MRLFRQFARCPRIIPAKCNLPVCEAPGEPTMRLTPPTLLGLALTLPALAAGRDAPLRQNSQQSTAPTIQVYSRETVVDVTVLDKDGKPVHGLTRGDFTVEEDGKPEAIRRFEEFGTGGSAAVTQAVEKLPPHVYTNRQAAATRGPLNIILMDTVNMDPIFGMRAKMEATTYLRRMPAGTRVALFSLGNELKFVQGFTTERQLLIAALNDMKNTLLPAGSAAGLCPDGTQGHLTIEALRQIGA